MVGEPRIPCPDTHHFSWTLPRDPIYNIYLSPETTVDNHIIAKFRLWETEIGRFSAVFFILNMKVGILLGATWRCICTNNFWILHEANSRSVTCRHHYQHHMSRTSNWICTFLKHWHCVFPQVSLRNWMSWDFVLLFFSPMPQNFPNYSNEISKSVSHTWYWLRCAHPLKKMQQFSVFLHVLRTVICFPALFGHGWNTERKRRSG